MSNLVMKKFALFLMILAAANLAAVNSYGKYRSIERNKIRHKFRRSVSEKLILTKLVKSLII